MTVNTLNTIRLRLEELPYEELPVTKTQLILWKMLAQMEEMQIEIQQLTRDLSLGRYDQNGVMRHYDVSSAPLIGPATTPYESSGDRHRLTRGPRTDATPENPTAIT
jgi:hypothetical protein